MKRILGILACLMAFAPNPVEAAGCDSDGDGHTSIICGGDDCDDADANRFPGNVEVCDLGGHDEDCNLDTPGLRDMDGDGYNSIACFNADAAGVDRSRGDDCDDMNSSVHPTASEVCNSVDDNCDGQVDENVTRPQYADADGDGFGSGPPLALCPAATGYAPRAGDCDDTNAAIHVGAQICSGSAEVLVCLTSGTYAKTACGPRASCHAQPNGTGVCECRRGLNPRTGRCQ